MCTYLASVCRDQLKDYLESPLDRKKAEKNFYRIFAKDSPVQVLGEKKFIEKTHLKIRQLLEWKASRHLFKRILATKKSLKILSGSSTDYQAGCIFFNYRKIHQQTFYYALNSDRERVLVKYKDNWIKLIHELIHALNDFEDPHYQGKTGKLLNSEFEDIDEQITITGVDTSSKPFKFYILNENLFLSLWRQPFRINHFGKDLEKGKRLNALDCIWLEAIGSLKNIKNFKPNNAQKIHVSQGTLLYKKKIKPLTAAACGGLLDLMSMLVEKGADVNGDDQIGGPIHGAVIYDQVLALSYLIHKGCDINGKDEKGNTSIMNAVKYGSFRCFELLLKKNVDLEAKNKKGQTVLMKAIKKARSSCVKHLIEKGATVPKHLKSSYQTVTHLF